MGRMDGNFRLRLPKLFLLSYLTAAFLFLTTSLFDFPQTSSLGYLLDFSYLKLFAPIPNLYFSLLELFSLPPFRKNIMFCLFRLSNTLSELWVSSSHTSWQ